MAEMPTGDCGAEAPGWGLGCNNPGVACLERSAFKPSKEGAEHIGIVQRGGGSSLMQDHAPAAKSKDGAMRGTA
jgi:hypothetical protein